MLSPVVVIERNTHEGRAGRGDDVYASRRQMGGLVADAHGVSGLVLVLEPAFAVSLAGELVRGGREILRTERIPEPAVNAIIGLYQNPSETQCTGRRTCLVVVFVAPVSLDLPLERQPWPVPPKPFRAGLPPISSAGTEPGTSRSDTLPPGSGRRLASHARELLRLPTTRRSCGPATTAGTDMLAQLQRHIDLSQSGLLTEQEFTATNAKLPGLVAKHSTPR